MFASKVLLNQRAVLTCLSLLDQRCKVTVEFGLGNISLFGESDKNKIRFFMKKVNDQDDFKVLSRNEILDPELSSIVFRPKINYFLIKRYTVSLPDSFLENINLADKIDGILSARLAELKELSDANQRN